jgi:hypothetical protein
MQSLPAAPLAYLSARGCYLRTSCQTCVARCTALYTCVADEIKLGGASAGSLLAACIKADMPLDGLVESNMRLMSDLRQGGTRGRLGVRACRPHPPPLKPAC